VPAPEVVGPAGTLRRVPASPLPTPRSLVTLVVVLVVAATCVRLGLWQLDRLEERRTGNARAEERLAAAPVDLASVADVTAGDAAAETLEWRQVEVRGVYRPGEEVLQRSRAHRGRNGYHVLTPLETADGTVVLVRRGWVPFELDEPPVAEARPPEGEVVVRGYLERSEEQASFGPTDPTDGRLTRVFRADVPRLDAQVAGRLWPLVVHLESQQPAPAELPVPADRPEFDDGNHLSYALQWFSFAAIAVVGYGFVLRSRRRERPDPALHPDDREPVGPSV
jgi:surfeit locus 1 family protein